jgi:hypothetical protein
MYKYISEKTTEFIDGKGLSAYEALGMALHPLMDATSPSHVGFQVTPDKLPYPVPAIMSGIYYLVWLKFHRAAEQEISAQILQSVVARVRAYYRAAKAAKEAAEEQARSDYYRMLAHRYREDVQLEVE